MTYKTTIELEIRKFCNTLSEKDKRRYAAIQCNRLIGKLLRKHKYSRLQKKQTMKTVNVVPPTNGRTKDKDAQFENIARFKSEYQDTGNPIISLPKKLQSQIGGSVTIENKVARYAEVQLFQVNDD